MSASCAANNEAAASSCDFSRSAAICASFTRRSAAIEGLEDRIWLAAASSDVPVTACTTAATAVAVFSPESPNSHFPISGAKEIARGMSGNILTVSHGDRLIWQRTQSTSPPKAEYAPGRQAGHECKALCLKLCADRRATDFIRRRSDGSYSNGTDLTIQMRLYSALKPQGGATDTVINRSIKNQ